MEDSHKFWQVTSIKAKSQNLFLFSELHVDITNLVERALSSVN